jgi:Asp-tRNA(Asn)/Glu-tRNA(Gln) amidotransferase A subunit family amidase
VWSATLGYAAVDGEQEAVARAAAVRLHEAGAVAWRPRDLALLDPGPAWRALRAGREDAAARHARTVNGARLDALFRDADVLLTPTTPTPPHGHDGPGEAMTVDLTWAFNVSGHPAVSVPAGFAADGTPVGLQAVAAHGREAALLHLAGAAAQCAVSAPAAQDPSGGAGSAGR